MRMSGELLAHAPQFKPKNCAGISGNIEASLLPKDEFPKFYFTGGFDE